MIQWKAVLRTVSENGSLEGIAGDGIKFFLVKADWKELDASSLLHGRETVRRLQLKAVTAVSGCIVPHMGLRHTVFDRRENFTYEFSVTVEGHSRPYQVRSRFLRRMEFSSPPMRDMMVSLGGFSTHLSVGCQSTLNSCQIVVTRTELKHCTLQSTVIARFETKLYVPGFWVKIHSTHHVKPCHYINRGGKIKQANLKKAQQAEGGKFIVSGPDGLVLYRTVHGWMLGSLLIAGRLFERIIPMALSLAVLVLALIFVSGHMSHTKSHWTNSDLSIVDQLALFFGAGTLRVFQMICRRWYWNSFLRSAFAKWVNSSFGRKLRKAISAVSSFGFVCRDDIDPENQVYVWWGALSMMVYLLFVHRLYGNQHLTPYQQHSQHVAVTLAPIGIAIITSESVSSLGFKVAEVFLFSGRLSSKTSNQASDRVTWTLVALVVSIALFIVQGLSCDALYGKFVSSVMVSRLKELEMVATELLRRNLKNPVPLCAGDVSSPRDLDLVVEQVGFEQRLSCRALNAGSMVSNRGSRGKFKLAM